MRKPLPALLCAAALFACGDNNHPGDDDVDIDASPTPDAAVPDAEGSPDAPTCDFAMGALGGECDSDDDCDSATLALGVCYAGPKLPSTFPPEGYCSLDALGTVCDNNDDCGGGVCMITNPPNGICMACDSDDDCGAGGLCLDSGGYRFCAPACCTDPGVTGGFCPPHQACWSSFNGFPNDRPACVPGNAEGVDGQACAGFYECNEYSQCTNDFEHPGGQCETFGAAQCTLGSTTGCNGGTCVADTDIPISNNVCVDTCDVDADCRMPEGYVCFDPDPGSTTDTKYCRAAHAGDPCATADDCGGGTWTCQTTGFTGGYCTQTGCATPGSTVQECTVGSACHDPAIGDNYCADRCTGTAGTQGSCRVGYLCIDVDPTPVTTLACTPTP